MRIRRLAWVVIYISTVAISICSRTDAFAGNMVKVNGYEFNVKGREPAVPSELEPTMDRKYKKWIVQFNGPIRDEQKKILIDLGCRIGDYIPEFSFLVTMDSRTGALVVKLPFIKGMVRYKPAYKIHKDMKDAYGAVKTEKGKKIKLNVRVDGAINQNLVLSEVLRKKGKVLDVSGDVLRVEVAQELIVRLSQIEEVIWIEEAVPLKVLNDTSKWVIQTYVPNDTKVWDKGLHGEGEIVGIGDTGLDYDMPWFHDPTGAPIGPQHRKVAGYDTTYGDDYDGDFGHGTHVAGTVGGDQTPVTGQTTANGMAPKARFFIQDITSGESSYVYPPSDLGLLFITPYNAGSRLHTNSWGAAVNQYETMARSTDRFMWDHKDFLAFFANGNSGPGSGSVGTPANAKNAVSVGATENGSSAENVAYFSSNGPTSDGRIKPTVTAPGVFIVSADSDGVKNSFNSDTVAYSGTSMATPTVAGAAALVRQYYLDGFWPSGMANPGDSIEPSAALVKATIINSAQNMTGSYTDAPIPSTGQGWGRINLSNALHFGGDAGELEIVDEHAGVNTAETWTRIYYAYAGRPFKVTLAWTDFPGIEGAATALVNDIDLSVTAPDGTVYQGNVFSDGASIPGGSPDRRNVEEQIFLPEPGEGLYTVTVTGYNVPFGPQPFALALTGASSVTSKGFVTLNKKHYNGSGNVLVTVGDRDLNAASDAVDEVTVTIGSTTEPGGETLQLVETGPDTAVFTASIPVGIGSAVPDNGILEAVDGDTVTAIYHDADDGTGLPVIATAGALIDLTPPAISSADASNIGETSASITWSTDEPSDSAVNYGETTSRGVVLSDARLVTEHTLLSVSGLQEAKTYYFDVSSRDEAGNSATDDNGGSFFTFTTQSLPPNVTVSSSEGGQTYYDTTTIFGIAIDPSGVSSVTVNGAPAGYRASDGYYELSVTLSFGANAFTVEAADTLGNVKSMTITVTRLHPSDLVMTAVSGPQQGFAGQIIQVPNTVSNIGEGGAGRFLVGIYLSADSIITKDDVLIGAWKVMSLAAGASASATTDCSISSQFPPGTYYIGAIADYFEIYDQYESDETNNSITGNQIQIEIGDLAMTEVSGVPGQGLTGQSILVTNTVTNTSSETTTPGFLVGIYFSEDAVITQNDTFLGYRAVSSLAPGASSTDATAVVVPATVPSGTYYVGAIADFTNSVSETDETNNILTAQNAISITGPDIVMTSVSGPVSARSGEVIEVSNTVTTRADGGGAPDFYVVLYLSTDNVITTSDIYIGLRWLPGLEPGATSTDPTGVMIPATVPPGTYHLGAIADNVSVQEGLEEWAYQEDNAKETDETNNVIAGNQITILGPDLAAASVNAAASVRTGAPIHFSSTITAGTAGGAAPQSEAAFYLSTDATITTSDTYLGKRTVPGLPPGGSSSAETVLTIPPGFAPGTYYIGVIADYDNKVIESDETNNGLAGNQVTITGPDLVMTAVSGPATALSGAPFAVNNAVTAAATGGSAPYFSVGFYLSTDDMITTSDVLIGTRSMATLAYGNTSADATTIAVPNTVAPGIYYLGAIADYDNRTADSDRANNALAGNQITVTGPDLVVTAVSGPASGFTGGTMIVSNTIAASAAGGGVSGILYAGIYLSEDAAITTSDTLIGYRSVPGLASGESSVAETTVTIPAGIAGGTYYIGAIADYGNGIVESDETNNSLTGNQIAITGSDLTMTFVSGPAAGMRGQNITVSNAVTANAAGGSAPWFSVGIFLSTDSIITASDTLIGSRSVPGLAPGATSSANTVVTIPANLAPGVYYIGAIADNYWIPCFECDPTGYQVSESDETNNALAGNTISIIPDLTMTAVSGPATGLAGGSITLATTVSASAGGSGASAFTVGLYLSSDSTITKQDRQLGTRSVSSLASGASSTANTTVILPSDLLPGVYYLGAIADINNSVPESDETNNTLAGNQIEIIGPDLVMTAVSGPVSSQAGGTITVSNTVTADASGAPAGFYVGIYLSSDAVITTSDRYLGARYVNGLVPGSSSTADTVVTIPITVQAGTYYIGVIADYNNTVGESNETNNSLAGNQIELAGPDLTMTTVSGPAESSRGATITVNDTVTNIGGLGASHFYVGIYLSVDAMITESDMLLGYRYVSALDAGASSAAATNVTIPSFMVPGTYYIGAIADNFTIWECDEWDCWDTGMSNRIVESNEANNALAGDQLLVTLP